VKKATHHSKDQAPLLAILAFPADFMPVSIILPVEFELTGEVQYSRDVTTEQLEYIKRLLELIVNDMADELLNRTRELPPWDVETGSISEDGDASE